MNLNYLSNKLSQNSVSGFKNFFFGWNALFGLINESFWKGIFGPFFAFGFPIIFIAILGNVLGYDQVLGGSLAISSVAITTTSMPVLLFEFKKSSLLKRIGSTPIKPSSFIFVTILYYLLIILSSVLWSIIFSLLIFGIRYWDSGRVVRNAVEIQQNGPMMMGNQTAIPGIVALSFKETLQNVNWFGFIWGQIVLTLTGLLFSMVIVSFAKSVMSIQSIGATFLITSQFLAAMVLPIGTVRGIEPMWFLGYVLSPFKPATNTILESWNGSIPTLNIAEVFSGNGTNGMNQAMEYLKQHNNNIMLVDFTRYSNPFDIHQIYYYFNNQGETVKVFETAEKVVSLVLPFLWMLVLGGISMKFFKWSAR